MKPTSRRWTSVEKSELERLLDAGKEAAEIAVALNRTRTAIYARLQRLYRKGARETKGEWGLMGQTTRNRGSSARFR
jgi:IS30 family transposase